MLAAGVGAPGPGLPRGSVSREQIVEQPISHYERCMQLESTITCPARGHASIEIMPTDACRFFYDYADDWTTYQLIG